jgi:hypothetical protein
MLMKWLENRTALDREVDRSQHVPPKAMTSFRLEGGIKMLGVVVTRLIDTTPLVESMRCYLLREVARAGDGRLLRLIYQRSIAQVKAILLGAAEGTPFPMNF